MLFRKLRCSFCRRDDKHVAKLVAGPRLLIPRVYICDKCAHEAIRIMETEPPPATQPGTQRLSMWARLFQTGRSKVLLRTTSATSIL